VSIKGYVHLNASHVTWNPHYRYYLQPFDLAEEAYPISSVKK